MTGSWPPWFDAVAGTDAPRRHEFAAGVHVGVLEFEVPGEGPCRSPVWCRYEDGWVMISLAVTAPHHERVTEVVRATLEIGDDLPPFGRVVLEGPLTVERVEAVERVVVISLRPDRWRRGRAVTTGT